MAQENAKTMFIDFGNNRIYVLTDEGDEVKVFDGLDEALAAKPEVVVADSYPLKCLQTMLKAEGVRCYRLKGSQTIAEFRKFNGIEKTDENDVKLLRELFVERPEGFIEVDGGLLRLKLLTEQWAVYNKERKKLKAHVVDETTKEIYSRQRSLVKALADAIHEQALCLPVYRRCVEELRLKGPSLAYLISHVDFSMSNRRLKAVLQMFDRGHSRRNTASQVLILLAYSIVRKKHPIYYDVFQRYYERFKHEGRKPMWRAVLRVANQVAKDIHRIAVETQTTPR